MGSHLGAESTKPMSYEIGRTRFSKRQLWVLMQIPSPAYKLRGQAFSLGPEVCNCHDSLKPP